MTRATLWLWARRNLAFCRIALFEALDTLMLIWPRGAGGGALIVRLDGIGDFVIWLQSGAADVSAELRRQHRRLILLANPAWADMARELGLWDEVIPIDPDRFLRRPTYRMRTLRMIRRLGLSIAVQPRAARHFLLDDEIIRVSGAPERVGSDALLANTTAALRARGNRGYTRIISVPLSVDVHESFRGQAFAAAFCESTGLAVTASRLLGSSSKAAIPDKPYIVLAIGAGWSGRRWPLEKFGALLDDLPCGELLCVLIGGEADRPLAQALRGLTKINLEDRCGLLTLSESVQLIAQSQLVIANESGPMHLGIWCGVPVLGLVGGGHFGMFAPYPSQNSGLMSFAYHRMPCYGCNWRCKFKVGVGAAMPCVRDIPVSDVSGKAHDLLRRVDGLGTHKRRPEMIIGAQAVSSRGLAKR